METDDVLRTDIKFFSFQSWIEYLPTLTWNCIIFCHNFDSQNFTT